MDSYLYEIIDDYKHSASAEEQNDIFQSFCSSIWASENKRRIDTRTIRFSVRKDLLHTDIGQVFDRRSKITYTGYKVTSKETDWCSLIRQKINNLYTRYFDKNVILKPDYLRLLNTPKRLYYQWTEGMEADAEELAAAMDDALLRAEQLKLRYQTQKMNLPWKEYKKQIEAFLQKIFDNCKLIDAYGDDSSYCGIYDFINEDNFYIRYFCKCLEGEMLKWQKRYYGVRDHKKYKHCKSCGRMIENTGNKKMYCAACARERKRISNKASDQKYRTKLRENRNS